MRTVTEKYRAVNEGKLDQNEFVRQMRLSYPNLISQYNGFKDTVQILSNRGLLFEEKTMKHDVSDESIRRALDIEIANLGHDPVTIKDGEVIEKAKAKAIANLSKDPLHYYNLLANESSKVDKHDKMKETKRGKLEKDTFNDLKKATLKERKENLVEGTRALVGYLAGDTLTTTYNHYDGYPSNLGKGLEAHYNDDEKAKDIAMKGYITYLNPETGEVEATHKDPAQKIKLPSEDEDMAREIADAINGMGGDFGYIWDDRSNRWITIKNTGTRSMIDQIMDKMGDYAEVQEADLDETEEEYLEKRDKAIKKAMGKDVDEVLSHEQKKVVLENAVSAIKKVYPELTRDIFIDFINTHYTDLLNDPSINVADEFMEWAYINGYMDTRPEDLEEGEKEMDDVYGDGDVVVDITGMSPGMKAVWEIEKEISEFGDSNDAQLVVDNMIEINSEEHLVSYLEDRGLDNQTIISMVKAYNSASISEKKGKDHDGDGDIDGDDYMAAKDKAIKKAMGKDKKAVNEYRGVQDDVIEIIKDMAMNADGDEIEAAMELMEFIGEHYKIDFEFGRAGGGNYGRNDGAPYEGKINEAVKNIVTKVLEEKVLTEAATNDLARIADDYGDFEGLKPAIIALQNIVTEIESFYDKTRGKIQKVYNDLGEVRNEEGLKVGAFIAPSIENAFKRDLKPITKNQFHGGLEMPQVKRISQADVDRGYVQQEAPKDTVFRPVNEKK